MSKVEKTSKRDDHPRVVVVGSINMDLVIRCPELPRPGQTILGRSVCELPGGKGANQAVAAARMGGRVSMIGRVGDDAFGKELINHLNTEGVDTSSMKVTSQTPSGLAVVSVDDHAENSIVVIPGANAELSVDDVQAASAQIESADILLVQLEISLKTVEAAVAIAHKAGVKVLLDPAPSVGRLPESLLQCDLICPNVTEAEAILGRSFVDSQDIKRGAQELVALGYQRVMITWGARGAIFCDGERMSHVPGFEVDAVDTTASGDAFAGTLAVAWCAEGAIEAAMVRANAAGAIVASRSGAQTAMPTAEEVESLLSARSG
jgi:ribokinase